MDMKSQPMTDADDVGGAVVVCMETATEVYREYDFDGRVYRIDRPATVEYRLEGTTHRVFDQNDVMHIVPAPGYFGCVVRVKFQPDNV